MRRSFRPAARSTVRSRSPPHSSKAAHAVEQAAKVPLFGCRDCGDCSLPDIAYVCPESQCAKNQRNGPCGGTREGLCEVYDTECIWSQAYERLKAYGEEETMLDGACDRQGQRAGTDERLGEYVPRSRPPRARTGNPIPSDAPVATRGTVEPRFSYVIAPPRPGAAASSHDGDRAGRPDAARLHRALRSRRSGRSLERAARASFSRHASVDERGADAARRPRLRAPAARPGARTRDAHGADGGRPAGARPVRPCGRRRRDGSC